MQTLNCNLVGIQGYYCVQLLLFVCVCSHLYVFKGTVVKHYSCGAGNIIL